MNVLVIARDLAIRDVLRESLLYMGFAVETSCPTFSPGWCLPDLVVLVGAPNPDADCWTLGFFRDLRVPLLYIALDNRFPPPAALTLRAPFELEALENAVRALLAVGAR